MRTVFEKLTLNDPAFNVQGHPLLQVPSKSFSLAIIHCSATFPRQEVTVQDIDRWHRQRGFRCIGYHFYITVDGTIWVGRPLNQVGAHCKGYNAHSVGICYEGGLDEKGRPKDTRTLMQKAALVALLNKLREVCPAMDVVGHRDLNPHKACPCFDAKEYDSDELRATSYE